MFKNKKMFYYSKCNQFSVSGKNKSNSIKTRRDKENSLKYDVSKKVKNKIFFKLKNYMDPKTKLRKVDFSEKIRLFVKKRNDDTKEENKSRRHNTSFLIRKLKITTPR